MSSATAIRAVYGPPEPGLPYLAVTISPEGDVVATSHPNFDEAEARVLSNITESNELGSD